MRFKDDTGSCETYFFSLDDKHARFERFADQKFTNLNFFFGFIVACKFAKTSDYCLKHDNFLSCANLQMCLDARA